MLSMEQKRPKVSLSAPPQEDRLFRKEERVVGCNLEGCVAGEEGVQWWKLVLVERCEFAVEEVGRETEYFGVHFQEHMKASVCGSAG